MKIITLLTLVSLLLLTSCGFKDGEEAATKELKSLVEKRMSAGPLFSESDYDSHYWKLTNKETWTKLTGYLKQSHGTLQSYEITDTMAKGRMKGIKSEGWVHFLLKTEYEKGVQGMERLSLYRPGKGASFKVYSHMITSDLIEKERAKLSGGQ